MKRKIFLAIGNLISYLLPVCITTRIDFALDMLYTGYLKRFFRHVGDNVHIEHKAASLVGLKYISIGKESRIGKNIRLTAWDNYFTQVFTPEISIGRGCNIGAYAHITACNKISIGNNVLIGPNVLITDNAHGNTEKGQIMLPPIDRVLLSKKPVVIEDDVWIGSGVCILPGVTVGKGAIVGANSVVSHDVPPYSVVGGIPARIIKKMEI